MADDTLTNTATLHLRPNHTVYKEDIVRVAGEEMVETLLTFDKVFFQNEARKTLRETTSTLLNKGREQNAKGVSDMAALMQN